MQFQLLNILKNYLNLFNSHRSEVLKGENISEQTKIAKIFIDDR